MTDAKNRTGCWGLRARF